MKKVALVTGASRGIGKAIALALSQLGYHLGLIATDEKKLLQTKEEIFSQSGRESFIFPLDVSDEKKVDSAVLSLLEKEGRIDILVNAAGIARHGTSELSHQSLRDQLNVNLVGAFNCIHAVAPAMKQQKSGYIFNIASRAGKVGIATVGGYSASKFALMGLNESLYNELTAFGIKVTALCPGYVNTDMAARASIPPEKRIPVEDIVKTIEFLLSLSPNSCVRDVSIDCCSTVEKMNDALLKSR